MIPGQGTSILKALGIFGTVIMLIVWLGPSLIAIGSAIKTGEWSGVLSETGGRVFSIDAMLQEETNYLLDESNDDQTFTKVFHLVYAFTLIFMLFFLAFMLFKLFNWIIGIKAFSPSSDILIILGVILIFLLIEFFYAYMVLDVTIIPLKDGVFYFLRNLPKIINGLL